MSPKTSKECPFIQRTVSSPKNSVQDKRIQIGHQRGHQGNAPVTPYLHQQPTAGRVQPNRADANPSRRSGVFCGVKEAHHHLTGPIGQDANPVGHQGLAGHGCVFRGELTAFVQQAGDGQRQGNQDRRCRQGKGEEQREPGLGLFFEGRKLSLVVGA